MKKIRITKKIVKECRSCNKCLTVNEHIEVCMKTGGGTT